jgi:hypothetical protein
MAGEVFCLWSLVFERSFWQLAAGFWHLCRCLPTWFADDLVFLKALAQVVFLVFCLWTLLPLLEPKKVNL